MATMSAIFPLVVLAAVHPVGPHPTPTTDMPAARGASTLSVPDGAGGQFIAWSDARDGDLDVYVTRVTNTGAPATGWPLDGVVVCNAPGNQTSPALYTDDAGGVVVTWSDARDDNWRQDLYAQRVDAAGNLQWMANGVRVMPLELGFSNQKAAPDGAGGLLVAWRRGLLGSGDIAALRIGGDGSIASGWDPAGVVVCDNMDDQNTPAIVSDGAGGAVVAWVDLRSMEQRIYAQRISAAGTAQWTSNGIPVDPGGQAPYTVALGRAAGNDTFVFWGSNAVAYGQRIDGSGAAQWGAAGDTLYSAGGSGQPDGDFACVPDGLGGAIVGWIASGAGMQGFSALRVDGTGALQWGAFVVSLAAPPPNAVDLTPDGAGGALVAWEDVRDGGVDPHVYVQRITAAGATALTTNGVRVAATIERQSAPSISPDGAGGFIVSWRDARSFDEEIFTQRFDATGATQFPADGVASFDNPGVQVGPLLLQTADGGALAVWNEKRSGRYDIRARKLNDDGTPAGPTTTVCDAPGNQIMFALVDDGAGGGIVGWIDFVFGDEKLFVQRVDGNGTPLWDANGMAVCGAPGNQETPRMISDGAGGVIVTWMDRRNPLDFDIYAQRFDADGAPQWSSNGAAVCVAPEHQFGPSVASDGMGGAIIAWNEYRSSQPVVYAQRMNASGAPQWTANGVEIANFSSSGWPAIVSGAAPDGPGGAIFLINQLSYAFITFEPQNTLYVQRIDGAGVRQWGTNGTIVCNAFSRVALEQTIADGTGGAFVAWSDERGGTSDIYGQHVDSGGSVTWDGNGNAVCSAIAWQNLGGMTRAGSDLFVTWTDYRSGNADVYAQRVDATGAQVWSTNGVVVSDAIRGQHLSSFAPWKSASPERLFVGWTDDRSGNARSVMVQRLDFSGAPQWAGDGVTGTGVALVSAEASAQRVRLVWYSSANVTATVYRRTESAPWSALGVASTDGSGQITFEDADVVPGARYAYRLGIREGASEVLGGESWVEVPRALELSLEGLRPNPAVRDVTVSFTLPRGNDARIDWLDVSGRRVRTQSLVGLSPGRHTLRLDGDAPAPGVYLLVLTQGDRTVTARGAIIR